MAKEKFALSPKKQKWANTFKPTKAIRGNVLNYPAPVENRYRINVEKMVAQVIKETEKEVLALFKTDTAKEYFAQDESVASQARILTNQLIKKIEKAVKKRTKTITMQMIRGVESSSAQQLRLSLKEMSGGLTIKTDTISGTAEEVLKASIDSNVELITRLTDDYLGKVKDAVARSIQNESGLQTLIPFLEKQAGMTKRRAKNVALDQTRKAYNSLNAARMQDVGVTMFEWIHTGGSQKPREFHLQSHTSGGLNGGIFSLEKPPIIDPRTGERGLPGQLPNCKCRMRPIVQFDEGEMQ